MRFLKAGSPPPLLVEQPLLAFGDAARGNSLGSLWAFGAHGRPAAFLELPDADDEPEEERPVL